MYVDGLVNSFSVLGDLPDPAFGVVSRVLRVVLCGPSAPPRRGEALQFEEPVDLSGGYPVQAVNALPSNGESADQHAK